MELHRLRPMKEDYSVELFNRLYKDTENLRKSLAYQIDARRYNVSPDIIKSWFDDKFIFVFNKHFDNKDPDLLKGFIINSLRTYKYRILRKAYSQEGLFHSSLVELEGEKSLVNIIPDSSESNTESVFSDLLREFMKSKLTDNAYILFELQLDPPPYILKRIKNHNSRIPNELIADYLGINLGDEHSTERYIKSLKKQINKTIKSAKEVFSKEESLALSF